MHLLKIARQLIAVAVVMLFASHSALATTGVESVVFNFSGVLPSPLIQASDGNFYGTSYSGGASSHGLVFRLTPGGSETILYSFTGGADGGTPWESLIEGNDGNLYGANTTGGSGFGVLFQLTLGGTLATLHTFSATDGSSAGALMQNNTGDIFGAATTGGASNQGTVFEYSHTGTFSILHTFTGNGGDGALPVTQLVQASDGLIYGSTRRGGSSASGSLFRFDPTNIATFTTFASFPPTGQSDPDYNPTFAMTEGADGALYGITAEGGLWGYGTIYKVVPGASPTVTLNLANFNGGTLGGLPDTGLTLGGDGNFYGTTSAYGPGGPPNGTIFQYIPSGAGLLSTIYAFSSPSGQPTGAPIGASDGNFYGPAAFQAYKLVLTPSVPPPVSLTVSSSSITLGSSVTLDWLVNNAFSQTAKNCYAHGDWSGSKPLTGSQLITPAAAGTYTYALTCGGVESDLATVIVTPVVTQTTTPVFTPNGGTFGGPVAYNITDATPGAIIHFTTNGSIPTLASPVWSGFPVVLPSSETIKAIAIKSPMTVSSVASATFVITPSSKTTCVINYINGFTSFAGLKLNHGASVVGSELNMTHFLLNETTSAFTIERIPVKVFATEFRFRFTRATPSSADGLTFTVQAKSPAIYGTSAAGLGYNTIPDSMAVKFDLHNDAGEGTNSIGVFIGGALPTVPSVDLTPSGINLHSGHIMDAYITVDGPFVYLRLTDTVTAAQFNHNFKLPVSNPFGSSYAYAGFTASTDSKLTSNAQVLQWLLEGSGPCALP